MQRDLFFKSRCKITVFLPIIGVLFPRKIGIDHKKCTFYDERGPNKNCRLGTSTKKGIELPLCPNKLTKSGII